MSKEGISGCLGSAETFAFGAVGAVTGVPGLTADVAAARGAITHEAAEAVERFSAGKEKVLLGTDAAISAHASGVARAAVTTAGAVLGEVVGGLLGGGFGTLTNGGVPGPLTAGGAFLGKVALGPVAGCAAGEAYDAAASHVNAKITDYDPSRCGFGFDPSAYVGSYLAG